LITARERATGSAAKEGGCDGRLVAYASAHAHSSVEKAVAIAGLGRRNFHTVDVDEHFAMRPDLLRQRIAEDRRLGRLPAFVCATVGTTSSTAIDPLVEIGRVCQGEGLWLHVDAAMSGTAALCPEYRFVHEGLELADSYSFNPHKWMFTNFDCDCFYVADRAALIRALGILPEYLRNSATESGAVIDYRDWQIPLGRRFRALKLWFVIRQFGVEGLQRHIRRHVALAQEFARWVDASPHVERVAPTPLNLVCFRHVGGDEASRDLLQRLNESGKLYLTHTKLGDRYVLRMSIGQAHTEERHVREAWRLIEATAAQIR
jgi:aromatic-L-amino-acid decarboxylase